MLHRHRQSHAWNEQQGVEWEEIRGGKFVSFFKTFFPLKHTCIRPSTFQSFFSQAKAWQIEATRLEVFGVNGGCTFGSHVTYKYEF